MKKIYILIGLICLVVIITVVGMLLIIKTKKPVEPKSIISYTVSCIDTENLQAIKNIPCTSDQDCSLDSMSKYCKPYGVDVLDCIGARYYCGDDGLCKGYDCQYTVEPEVSKINSIDEAVDLIKKEYPKLVEAAGNFSASDGKITSKGIQNGWKIQIHWRWCPDCFCAFNVYKSGVVEKIEEGNCPYNKGEQENL